MKKLLIALCGLSMTAAFADNFKIGYINVDRVMAEATPAKTISNAIQTKFADQQTKLTQLNQKVVADESGLIALQNKASSFEKLSKADQKTYKEKNEVYAKDKNNFIQQYTQYQQQVSATEQYALNSFLKQSYEVLKTLGSKNDLDLVLTSNQLVYAKAKYDLTDQLLTQIDKMDVSDIVKQVQTGPVAPQAPAAQASK
ncbi:MAG: OmpH family outer membrane protein [Burkholderiales bacterium]|nr:OmpH family outer membrane protein [Burkholderiales bacterium]